MGAGGFFLSLFGGKHDEAFDERFIMHRFKSTRFAVLVGSIAMLALFTYYAAARDTIRWDLFGVMAVMAAAKIAAMLYYRRTN